MTPQDIAGFRLRSQWIVGSAARTPAEVVAHFGAMQAQDHAGALWAIGLRLPDATETDVERAVAEREIVRTWPMRGTLHFVAADDIRWMLELMTPRVIAASRKRWMELELSDTIFAQCRKVLEKLLQGGVALTRDDLLAGLEKKGISTAGGRSYHIPWRLAQERVLCFGPRAGKQKTFVLLDEWVPKSRKLAGDEALAELALRYFASHGPATQADFVWWSGLKSADARAAIALVAPQLASETADGKTYWMRGDSALPGPSPGFLLPGFDEYLLGYTDRSAVLDARHAVKIVPGSNGIFLPMLVNDG
ncbi:MAG: winged helix DNA-binding domain-containing protein, partial [Chthoniobacterales bacterium]